MNQQSDSIQPVRRRMMHRYRPDAAECDQSRGKFNEVHQPAKPARVGPNAKGGLGGLGAHQIARSVVRQGVTTAEIDAVIDEYFQRHSAVPLFKGVPGKTPFPAATCISINEQVVHGIPGARRLKEGDIVSLDTGCKVNGWCGDSAYTHPVGGVSPDVQRLLDVTRTVLDLAIELMAVRNRWSEVAREMGSYVRDHGFSVVENFVGHGIGREMHEEPQVPNFISPQLERNHDFRLETGLVIAVEPMVNMGTKKTKTLSDHWTQSTSDGKYSAHFEHTIAMTANGPWVLTAPPQAGEEFDDSVLREMLGRVPQPA